MFYTPGMYSFASSRTGLGFLQRLPAIWKVDKGDLPEISKSKRAN